MKKRMISLSLVIAMIFTQISFMSAFAETSIESAFTDTIFLNAVREIIGKTNNEPIYSSDVENITELNIANKKITHLAGIEYFTGLEALVGFNNRMKSLDLSNNTNLVYLDISYNTDIQSINIDQNVNLEELHFDYTSLRHIDLSKNVNLKNLTCCGSEIRELNIMNNTLLEKLEAYESCLAYLDVSNNTNLTYLDCSYNYIPAVIGLDNLDIEEACVEPQLTDESINKLFDEQFLGVIRDEINKPEGEIYQSDVDKITKLSFYAKNVSSLDGIEHLKSLEYLDCMNNEVQNVSLYSNKNLKVADLSDNKLEKIDISGNTQLENLSVAINQLEELDVSHNEYLEELYCNKNLLTSLNISNNKSLGSLHCTDNLLTQLDTRENKELWELVCYNNKLTELNIENNLELIALECYENYMDTKEPDISIIGLEALKENLGDPCWKDDPDESLWFRYYPQKVVEPSPTPPSEPIEWIYEAPEYLVAGEELTISINNFTEDCNLILALYKDDQLISLSTKECKDIEKSINIILPYNFNLADNYSLIAFAWDDLLTMTPIAERFDIDFD